LEICTVKPLAVGVGVSNVGVRAAPVMEVADTDAEPLGNPNLEVFTVNVEDVPG
jgi:hypothetical protein